MKDQEQHEDVCFVLETLAGAIRQRKWQRKKDIHILKEETVLFTDVIICIDCLKEWIRTHTQLLKLINEIGLQGQSEKKSVVFLCSNREQPENEIYKSSTGIKSLWISLKQVARLAHWKL